MNPLTNLAFHLVNADDVVKSAGWRQQMEDMQRQMEEAARGHAEKINAVGHMEKLVESNAAAAAKHTGDSAAHSDMLKKLLLGGVAGGIAGGGAMALTDDPKDPKKWRKRLGAAGLGAVGGAGIAGATDPSHILPPGDLKLQRMMDDPVLASMYNRDISRAPSPEAKAILDQMVQMAPTSKLDMQDAMLKLSSSQLGLHALNADDMVKSAYRDAAKELLPFLATALHPGRVIDVAATNLLGGAAGGAILPGGSGALGGAQRGGRAFLEGLTGGIGGGVIGHGVGHLISRNPVGRAVGMAAGSGLGGLGGWLHGFINGKKKPAPPTTAPTKLPLVQDRNLFTNGAANQENSRRLLHNTGLLGEAGVLR